MSKNEKTLSAGVKDSQKKKDDVMKSINEEVINPSDFETLFVMGVQKNGRHIIMQSAKDSSEMFMMLTVSMKKLIDAGGKGNVLSIMKAAGVALTLK